MGKPTITVNEKRGRGRPATGVDPAVSARLPEELVLQLDAWAKKHGLSRGQAIRRLVEVGLNVKMT